MRMNTVLKYIISLFLFSCNTICALAQSSDDIHRVSPENIQRSPQAADMIRFGDVPVAMNSGRLDLSIPVIKIQDPDFDIDISLAYNSSGFMPMKHDGYIGLGWSLSSLGTISREVKGMPDDQVVKRNDVFNGYDQQIYGFLKIRDVKKLIGNSDINNDDINNNYVKLPIAHSMVTPVDKNVFLEISSGGSKMLVDASSDIYHFNFGKHSGKFMINYDGSINVVSYTGGKYEIDISDFKMSNPGEPAALGSTIKIKTDDGYTYYFGGNPESMESHMMSWYNKNGSGFMEGYSNAKPVTNSFHLTKIVAPNNRELSITYRAPNIQQYSMSTIYRLFTQTNKDEDFLTFSTSSSSSEHFSGSLIGDKITGGSQQTMYHLNKIALISSIYIGDNEHINFNYSLRKDSYLGGYSGLGLPKYVVCGAQLDGITHYSSNKSKTYEFKYEKWGEKYPRRLLSELILNKDQKYSFSYWDGIVPPPPYTTNIDYWNYWKGYVRSEGGSLLPKRNITPEGDLTYTSSEREPIVGSPYSNAGMLKSVTYPTGGSSEFEYEQHDYSQILQRKNDNKFLPKLYNENKIAGGVRLKKTTDISAFGQKEVKEYIYKKSRTGSRSSGILHSKPAYFDIIKYLWSYQDNNYYFLDGEYYIFKSSDAGFNTPSYEKDHVTYSSVIEERKSDRLLLGYTETEFSDYKSNPDIVFEDNFPRQSYAITNNDDYSINYTRELIDMSHSRGKIISQKIFDSNLSIQKEVISDYLMTNSDKFNLYITNAPRIAAPNSMWTNVPEWWPTFYQANKILFNVSLLKEKTSKDFIYTDTRKDSIVTKETFRYDPLNYLQKQITSSSDNRNIIKEYIRPTDLGLKEDVYDFMVTNNFLAPVVIENTYLDKRSGGTGLISQKINNYRIHYSKDVNNIFIPPILFPVVDSQEISIGTHTPEERVVFPEHDDYGNPLIAIKNGGTNTIYLWSYMGRCMIAKIKGAKLEEVETAVRSTFGVKDIKSLSRQLEVSLDGLNNLRTHPSLKNALVATYQYEPFGGGISATDFSGKTTFYDYDDSGRLKRTYIKEDGVEKNIQSYEYNYSIK